MPPQGPRLSAKLHPVRLSSSLFSHRARLHQPGRSTTHAVASWSSRTTPCTSSSSAKKVTAWGRVGKRQQRAQRGPPGALCDMPRTAGPPMASPSTTGPAAVARPCRRGSASRSRSPGQDPRKADVRPLRLPALVAELAPLGANPRSGRAYRPCWICSSTLPQPRAWRTPFGGFFPSGSSGAQWAEQARLAAPQTV